MRLRALSLVLLVAPFGAVMCTPSTDQGTVQILTVDDPFEVDGAPPTTQLLVQSVAYDDGGANGAVSTLAGGPATQGSLDLGTYDESNTESLLVTAKDPESTTVAWGETLPLELGAIAGLSIGVFVQRAGTLSRMPSPLGDGRPAPLLGIVGGRYIFVAGGSDSTYSTQTQLYDLISWAPLAAPPTLSFAPESIVIAQPTEGDFQALAINSTGAQWYDLTDSDIDDASAPSGIGSWAEVAGGATITCPNQGTSFIVGATRTSNPPTSTVLIVTSSGALSWANLATVRLGATAACLDTLGGIVVEGGNIPGSTTPDGSPPQSGLEFLSGSGTSTTQFDYPADTTTGAGMVALDGSHLLVVGGASAQVFTVPCTTCTSTPWGVALPTPLVLTQVFDLDSTNVFVVGQDANQITHAYTLSYVNAQAATVVEIPFRVPRSQARAIALPYGTPGIIPIAVVGGAPDAGLNTGYIESFIPTIPSPFVP